MPKRRKTSPNRTATRHAEPLRSAHDEPPLIDVDCPPIIAATLRALATARHRLQAEMAVTRLPELLDLESPFTTADDAARSLALCSLFSELIEFCMSQKSSSALGFLRLAGELGPGQCREIAVRAAQELAGQGVDEPRWVSTRLRFLRAWRCDDSLGHRVSVGLVCAYGSREHVMFVDIESGAIRDIALIIGRGAGRFRDDMAESAASESDMTFTDIHEQEALAVLREALVEPPVPVSEREVEDVDANFLLLHARVAKLAEMLGEPPVELWVLPDEPEDSSGGIFRVTVTLDGSNPPIWRQLEVPTDVSLARFHQILQVAFDWEGYHLHAFETFDDGRRESVLEGARLRRTKLSSVVSGVGDRLEYVYDFDDSWRHVIVVEAREPAMDGVAYPRCTDGRLAAPPEECGGMRGYELLLAVLENEDDPAVEELLDWASDFEPGYFRPGLVNLGYRDLFWPRPVSR